MFQINPKKKKKILIVGSNSFSGSNLVNYLLSKKYSVLGISRSREKNLILRPYAKNKYLKNFNFIKIDLNKSNKKDLKKIILFNPEIIFNFSAQGMVAESWNNPDHWFQTNIVAQSKFLKFVQKNLNIKKYIQFTTPEVYGSTNKKIKESFNFNPSTPYANSRACFDNHLLSLYKNYNFPVIFTRTANVFGPFQDLYRIIPVTIMRILQKKNIIIHGKGSSERSFILMEDVCIALEKIMNSSNIGQTYHISTNKFISIKKLCLKIKKIFNSKNKLIYTKDRVGKDKAYKLSSNKLRKNFKWKEINNFDYNLRFTCNWYLNNFNKLNKLKLNYEHKK